MSARYPHHVTVVIPVFNEQERIAKTLYAIKDYLSMQDFCSDVLIIDDGSNDLTSEIVKVVNIYGEEVKSQKAGLLVQNVKNVGKGYSIAKGLLLAKGEIIVFTDADSSTPIEELEKLIHKIDEGFDIVIGSRTLPDSEISCRPGIRSAFSKAFNLTASLLGLVNVSDSQCGFKAYRRDCAQDIATRQQTTGYCFDVEHLHMAEKLGYKVAEVPVRWTHETGSTVSLLNDSLSMFVDLIKIRWTHRKL